MANKVAPLQSLIGFSDPIYKSGDLTVIAAKSNKGDSNYSFKADSFEFEPTIMTGIKDDKGKLWFVCCQHETKWGTENIFEIAYKEQTDGKWGINKEKSGTAEKLWLNDGCIVVIDTDGIEGLALLAKVLDEYKLLCYPIGKLKVRFSLGSDKESIEENLCKVLTYCMANGRPSGTANPVKKNIAFLGEHGLKVLPVSDEDRLPKRDVIDDLGEKEGEEIKCFPYESDELPYYTKLNLVLPEVKERSASRRGSYGAVEADPAKVLEARKAFILTEFKAIKPHLDSLETIYEVLVEDDEFDGSYFDFLIAVIGKN
jgi:hypothetical protein